jgi:hypothetical protein
LLVSAVAAVKTAATKPFEMMSKCYVAKESEKVTGTFLYNRISSKKVTSFLTDLTGFHGILPDQLLCTRRASPNSRHDKTCQVFTISYKSILT